MKAESRRLRSPDSRWRVPSIPVPSSAVEWLLLRGATLTASLAEEKKGTERVGTEEPAGPPFDLPDSAPEFSPIQSYAPGARMAGGRGPPRSRIAPLSSRGLDPRLGILPAVGSRPGAGVPVIVRGLSARENALVMAAAARGPALRLPDACPTPAPPGECGRLRPWSFRRASPGRPRAHPFRGCLRLGSGRFVSQKRSSGT